MTRAKGQKVTPAQASTAYRQRQNALGPEFKQHHAQRQWKSYIPRRLLSKDQLMLERQRGREKSGRFRALHKAQLAAEAPSEGPVSVPVNHLPALDVRRSSRLTLPSSSPSATLHKEHLVVKLAFPHHQTAGQASSQGDPPKTPAAPRRRHPKVYRDLAKSKSKVKNLERQLATYRQKICRAGLACKFNTPSRRVQRKSAVSGRKSCLSVSAGEAEPLHMLHEHSKQVGNPAALGGPHGPMGMDMDTCAPNEHDHSDVEMYVLDCDPSVMVELSAAAVANTVDSVLCVHDVAMEAEDEFNVPVTPNACASEMPNPSADADLNQVHVDPSPATKVKHLVRSMGLSPSRVPSVTRRLTFAESVVADLRDASKETKQSVLYGKHVSHGRFRSMLSSELKFSRNQRVKSANKNGSNKRTRMAEERKLSVANFLLRADNSSCLPGKRDFKKVNGKKVQKHILLESLEMLYEKFKIENPGSTLSMSFATFCRYRPQHVLLVRYRSRQVCLCSKHQNVDLRLQMMQRYGSYPPNSDQLATLEISEVVEEAAQTLPDNVASKQWQRLEVNEGGKIFYRVKLVSLLQSKAKFLQELPKVLKEFQAHVFRVKTQYAEAKNLKDNLGPRECTIQLDFAENYTTGHFCEVQSAYFSKPSVTIHPAVVHYKEGDLLKVKSYAVLSDDRRHIAGTVYSFLKALLPHVVSDMPNVRHIHYLSDSPSSQYRNRKVFSLLLLHAALFNRLTADWLYFESGHGKGPCDGVGGASKRNADLAVKRGVIISSAEEYCVWGNSSSEKIKYLNVSPEEVTEATESLEIMSMKKSLSGTMLAHCAVVCEPGTIAIRPTACFGSCCFDRSDCTYPLSCSEWQRKKPKLPEAGRCPSGHGDAPQVHVDTSGHGDVDTSSSHGDAPQVHVDTSGHGDVDTSSSHGDSPQVHVDTSGHGDVDTSSSHGDAPQVHVDTSGHGDSICPGTYVAVSYEREWYMGRVEETNVDDDHAIEYKVKYFAKPLSESVATMKWGGNKDWSWVWPEDILCTVDKPLEVGRRKLYKFADSDIERAVQAMRH